MSDMVTDAILRAAMDAHTGEMLKQYSNRSRAMDGMTSAMRAALAAAAPMIAEAERKTCEAAARDFVCRTNPLPGAKCALPTLIADTIRARRPRPGTTP